MARHINKLSSLAVKQSPAGKFCDGLGLWLIKSDSDTGNWVLRIVVHGRRREMGLGSIADVSLKEARDAAAHWRFVVRSGKDPIREREREKRERARNMHLLADVAKDAFEARKAELKDDGKAGRWSTPLDLHVIPKLGKTPVAEIDQIAIRDALKPIWHSKAETARKAMNRLGIVIRHAAALGLDVDLQAVMKAKALLGAHRHVAQHIPAMHWREIPEFYSSLNDGSVAHLALRLLILTGVRSKPLRFIREDQIAGDTWTIPASMMKGREGKTEDFTVPLSSEALSVIEQAKRHARNGYLFPNAKKGVLSDATMSRLMERRKLESRPHGFRSSIRTYLADVAKAPREVAETVLGHKSGTDIELAYRRTSFLDDRRILMEMWAGHCIGRAPLKVAAE